MTRKTNAFVRTLVAAAAFALPAAFAMAAPPAPPAPAAPADSAGTITSGYTKPWERAEMTLPSYGIIREIKVREGDRVKVGDVLLKQDDRADVKALEQFRLEADSTVRVEAAQADLEVKKNQLKREEDLEKQQAGNRIQLEEARMKVVYADATTKVEQLNNLKAKLDADRQGIKIEQMTLSSTLDGVVEKLEASVGEVTDPQKTIVHVVKRDPLKVELSLPSAQVEKLKVGDTLEVRYHNDGPNAQWRQAKVIYIAPVAEADADTAKINLELPNPEDRMAGLWVSVKVPEAIANAQPAAAVEKPEVAADANARPQQ